MNAASGPSLRQATASALSTATRPPTSTGARLEDHQEQDPEQRDDADGMQRDRRAGAQGRRELVVRLELATLDERLGVLSHRGEVLPDATAGAARHEPEHEGACDPAVPQLIALEVDREPDPENERPESA